MLYKEGLGVPSISHYMVKGQVMQFTLYFEPLPVDCVTFTIHITPQENQYLAAGDVARRQDEIYQVELEIVPF